MTERAQTEPRFARGTAPPPAPAEASPYDDIEISIGKPERTAEGTGSSGRYVKTVPRSSIAHRDSGPDLEPHLVAKNLAHDPFSELDDIATDIARDVATDIANNVFAADRVSDVSTNPFSRVSTADLAQSTLEVERVLDSLMEPPPDRKPLRLQWLGVVLTPPEVDASLVIGTWMRKDFCVTSAVTRVVQKDQGMLVKTLNRHYFVKHSGDTYLVRDRDER